MMFINIRLLLVALQTLAAHSQWGSSLQGYCNVLETI